MKARAGTNDEDEWAEAERRETKSEVRERVDVDFDVDVAERSTPRPGSTSTWRRQKSNLQIFVQRDTENSRRARAILNGAVNETSESRSKLEKRGSAAKAMLVIRHDDRRYQFFDCNPFELSAGLFFRNMSNLYFANEIDKFNRISKWPALECASVKLPLHLAKCTLFLCMLSVLFSSHLYERERKGIDTLYLQPEYKRDQSIEKRLESEKKHKYASEQGPPYPYPYRIPSNCKSV